ncbi:PREDICTED: lymphocyte function-associated antigen 3 [Galeopterus variegatus]|uniref:Lymphocyte function-associated antigen 3 n=1 Tax=Galeopterus variegatus TaxID=482537 RepID=A0ABM0RJ59_GALVR|nr:PREDICTED: lymphocyte function-associated antigen 3 [Galeopterus variegatus]
MASASGPGPALGVLSVISPLVRFGFISCDSILLYGVVNNNITFPTSRYMPFKEITWKKHKDKVVEWESNYAVKTFPSFVGRVHLDTTSGNLTIFNLTSSDEGEYEIESPDIKESSKFSLIVIGPLPSVTLTCALTGENIVVQCSIPEHNNHPELITYSWNCPSEQCKNHSMTEIYFGIEDDLSQETRCTVSNPLFKSTSSVLLETCVPSNGHLRHRFVLIAVFVAAIVVCVVVVWIPGNAEE